MAPRKLLLISDEEIKRLYVEEEMGMKKIARIAGTRYQQVITHRLRDMGVEIRRPGRPVGS